MANDDAANDALSFVALYTEVIGEPLDAAEFEADDLYAFLAFERGLASPSDALKELAERLQTRRQERLESIVMDSGEWPRMSRMPKIAMPEPVAEAAGAALEAAEPPKPERRERRERRAGASRLNPKQVAAATDLQRHYHNQFGRALDIARFVLDDTYGRLVLDESLATGNLDLARASARFLDGQGQSRMHRRYGDGGARRQDARPAQVERTHA